jgi:hypothetical protein
MLKVGWRGRKEKISSLPVGKLQCSRDAVVARSVLKLKALLESKLAYIPKPTRLMRKLL